jgi:hypothetical protein
MVAQDFLDLLNAHLARYPLMAPQDAYKLLYQGILGAEHLLAAPEVFAARLRAEYEAVPPAADAPLYEPVRPDGRLLRVNLRPFKAGGGNLERLLDACLAAASLRWGMTADLTAAWADLVEACGTGRWPHLGDVAAFSTWLEANGYPAVHHSPEYREAYRPAYRLVRAASNDLINEVTHA